MSATGSENHADLSTEPFAPLDSCCYMRKATEEDGRLVWVLFRGDGEPVCIDPSRSAMFFAAFERELRLMWLN